MNYSENIQEHPFYPQNLVAEGYVPQQTPVPTILGVFFGFGTLIAVVVAVALAKLKHIQKWDRAIFIWFLLTSIVHMVYEGYWVLNPDYYKDTSAGVLVDTWKEYTKADSRYLTRAGSVTSIEVVTAFAWGPICALIVLGKCFQSSWVMPVQISVSMGQMYGCILYLYTFFLEGGDFARPEFLYFWFYMVIVNSIWIVIPFLVIVHDTLTISSIVHHFRKQMQFMKTE